MGIIISFVSLRETDFRIVYIIVYIFEPISLFVALF